MFLLHIVHVSCTSTKYTIPLVKLQIFLRCSLHVRAMSCRPYISRFLYNLSDRQKIKFMM